MNEDNPSFLRHRTVATIVLVVIFMAVGIYLWKTNVNIPIDESQLEKSLTQDQIEAIVNDKPIGPGVLTAEERKEILEDKPKGTSTLTVEQREQILNDKPREN